MPRSRQSNNSFSHLMAQHDASTNHKSPDSSGKSTITPNRSSFSANTSHFNQTPPKSHQNALRTHSDRRQEKGRRF